MNSTKTVSKTRDELLNEAMELVMKATPEVLNDAIKYARLSLKYPDFNKAVVAATPAGSDTPPLPVLNKLIAEWSELDGEEENR